MVYSEATPLASSPRQCATLSLPVGPQRSWCRGLFVTVATELLL